MNQENNINIDQANEISQDIIQNKQDAIGLDDFLKDFQAPKEPFDEVLKETIPGSVNSKEINLPGVDSLPDGNIENKQIDIAPNPSGERRTHLEAKMIVSIADGGIGKVCQFLAQSESSQKYRAEKEEKDDLTLLLAEYLKESGGKVPVWILLLILAGSIYAPNIYLAWQEGKNKNNPKPKESQKENNNNVTFSDLKPDQADPGFTFDPIKTDIVEVKVRSCKNCGKELKANQKQFCGNICKNKSVGKIPKKRKRKVINKNINTYEVLPS